MGIMTGGSAKSSIVIVTSENEINGLVMRECIRVTKEVKSRQPPIDPVQSQVFGQPIIELIFSLERNQIRQGAWNPHERTVSRLWMYLTWFSMTKPSSGGRSLVVALLPPTPGPATRDMRVWVSSDGVWILQSDCPNRPVVWLIVVVVDGSKLSSTVSSSEFCL